MCFEQIDQVVSIQSQVFEEECAEFERLRDQGCNALEQQGLDTRSQIVPDDGPLRDLEVAGARYARYFDLIRNTAVKGVLFRRDTTSEFQASGTMRL